MAPVATARLCATLRCETKTEGTNSPWQAMRAAHRFQILDWSAQAKRKEGKFYPLVVKLGTITPRGADVFSYAEDEDDMVEDPHLAEHLAHWGIDIMKMEKTEKSMTEMQIDRNMRVEFDAITEAGSDLKPISGAGYIGMKNLGNSCYLNSVMQVVKELPEVSRRYLDRMQHLLYSAPRELPTDFPTQMAKLLNGLLSDRYETSATHTVRSDGLTCSEGTQRGQREKQICLKQEAPRPPH